MIEWAPRQMGGRPGRRLWLAGLAAILAIGVAVLATGAGQGLDRQLRMLRDGLRERPASGEIAIIEIDAQSLAAQGRWPWPRQAYADLVDRLAGAGVRTLAFDVDFSSASNPQDDAAFGAALDRFGGGAVLPTFRQRAGGGGDQMVENLPIPELREHVFLGSVNVHPDPDGQMRRYSYGTATAGTPRPSIAALLAERPGRIGDSFDIDFSIDPASIPRFSFDDVVSGKVGAPALAGKRLIVGATAIELGDGYAVPRYGVQPGVVIQALAAETLMRGSTNPSLGAWPLIAIALLASAGALTCRFRVTRALAFVFGCGAVVFLPLALEAAKLGTLDAAPALAMLGLAATIRVITRIRKAFHQAKLIDVESGLPNGAALAAHFEGEQELILVAARIGRFDEVVSVLDARQRAALVSAVVDRVRIAAGGGQLHRTANDTFMWPSEVSDQALADALEALSALFRTAIQLEGRSLVIKPAFGIARRAGGSVADLKTKAALAATRAAQKGQIWAAYDEVLAAEADRTVSLLADLDHALADCQLWVAFQPKLDLATGRIVGAEALVRWDHPQRGAISPAVFVPLLEAEGHAAELTMFVLDQVLDRLSAWGRDGHRPSVAINVSASLLGDQSLAADLEARVRGAGIDPAQIVFEVTESAAIASAAAAVETVERLRVAGFGISVDDYGTGQSTLSYLKQFPANEIKIDQSFVRNMTTDPHDRILVRSTIELAHELGLKVVAEGIEDQASLELLRSFNCDLGQGWVIGRPVKAEVFIETFAGGRRAAA